MSPVFVIALNLWSRSQSFPNSVLVRSNCAPRYEWCVISRPLTPRTDCSFGLRIVLKRVVCMYNGDKRVLAGLALALAAPTLHTALVTILTSYLRNGKTDAPFAICRQCLTCVDSGCEGSVFASVRSMRRIPGIRRDYPIVVLRMGYWCAHL
jgi:hypothetical protein